MAVLAQLTVCAAKSKLFFSAVNRRNTVCKVNALFLAEAGLRDVFIARAEHDSELILDVGLVFNFERANFSILECKVKVQGFLVVIVGLKNCCILFPIDLSNSVAETVNQLRLRGDFVFEIFNELCVFKFFEQFLQVDYVGAQGFFCPPDLWFQEEVDTNSVQFIAA